MKHRIRAAALITDGDQILLVQHVHPITGEAWWVPPGGGLEASDGSIFDCAEREVFEETGLRVEVGRIAYIGEFLDQENDVHNIEVFLTATRLSGELTIRHVQGNGPDEHYIRSVKWVSRTELGQMVVYPEVLKDTFWADRTKGFLETRYLGVQAG
jgi:8-oxo-dGTP pyrophosphatase MutT (NUDIX family)